MRWILIALVALGCGDKKQPASATTRPAVVTQDMADTFEAYVAAFEKLAADIEHAGKDCQAALVVVQRDTKDIAALAPRGEQLRDAIQGVKGDQSAGEWFGTTFGPRMKTASEKLAPLDANCGQSTELETALGAAMEQFPMMRKKHAP
jgi:predicted RNase H-like nuclease (RuvC/YqgF family)